MAIQKIQTLHPQPGKTNKNISLDKYNFIRKNLLAVLGKKGINTPRINGSPVPTGKR